MIMLYDLCLLLVWLDVMFFNFCRELCNTLNLLLQRIVAYLKFILQRFVILKIYFAKICATLVQHFESVFANNCVIFEILFFKDLCIIFKFTLHYSANWLLWYYVLSINWWSVQLTGCCGIDKFTWKFPVYIKYL